MKGYGMSFGAISVLNAIPCGLGSCIGIRLRTTASFRDSFKTEIIVKNNPGVDTTLAKLCVEETLKKLGKEVNGYRLFIETEIPIGVGLKSSSSMCNAVVMAVADAFGSDMSYKEILKIGAKCSKKSGVSITGAFDDACGCHYGGLVFTDNDSNMLLYKKNIPIYDVILVIPENAKKKSVDTNTFKKMEQEYQKMAGKLSDKYFEIIAKNGEYVSAILGYGNEIQKKAMIEGALAAGVSGNGPAVAIIAERGKGKEIAEKLGCRYILTETRPMCLSFGKGKISGTLVAPPSKSYTHRALVLSSLANGKTTIKNPLYSMDIESTVNALRLMGAEISMEKEKITVESNGLHGTSETINAGNSGTTMRFIAGVASLLDEEITIDGDESLKKRPMKDLTDALESCGVKCSSDDGKAPFRIKGPIDAEEININGNVSSQFVSSLLMISPRVKNKVRINVLKNIVSRPYVDLTVSMMEKFGAKVQKTENGFETEPQEYKPCEITIPGDWSSVSFMLVAAALSGSVTIKDTENKIQGDRRILDILEKCGAVLEIGEKEITCKSNGRPKAVNLNISDIPDLFPIVAVLLATADGTSVLSGGEHLKFKESNRIRTTVRILRNLGADIRETSDGCVINGVEVLRGGYVKHYSDHRIMMSAAVASLVSRGPVFLEDNSCWKVSYPGFVDDLYRIGVKR